MKKIKKWNWTLFSVMMCVSCMGALQNKNAHSFYDGSMLVLILGLPISLISAIVTKDIE